MSLNFPHSAKLRRHWHQQLSPSWRAAPGLPTEPPLSVTGHRSQCWRAQQTLQWFTKGRELPPFPHPQVTGNSLVRIRGQAGKNKQQSCTYLYCINSIYNSKKNKIVPHIPSTKCICFMISVSFQFLSNCINIFVSGSHSVDSIFVIVFLLTFHKMCFHAPIWFYNYTFNDYVRVYRYTFILHC